MKHFSRPIGASILGSLTTLTAVGLTAMPLQAAQISKDINGSLGIAENACVLPISLFVGLNCNYSGGPLVATDLGLPGIGPLDSGGFYASVAAAPGFTLSTQTGIDANGIPLTSFLVGVPASPGDGKTHPSLTGTITIDDGGNGFGDTTDTISGTFIIGPAARVVATGNSLAGAKSAIEQWTSITHTLAPTTVDSATANGLGGFDYVLGSAGFPPQLCTGTGSGGVGDCFASEQGSDSGLPVLSSPWRQENGGNLLAVLNSPDITRYGLSFAPPGPNPGGATTAVISGLTCFDTGLDPTFPSDPVDTLTDCQSSPVVWGVVDPVDTDAGKLNAGIDNLVLMLSTDASGNIVSANAYYTMEYPIIQPDDNSFVGGTLSFTGSVPPPTGTTEIDIFGTQTPVDGACIAPLPFFNGEDCSYNESNPTTFGLFWLGPVSTAGYYPVGQSPFALGTTDDTPVIGDNKFAVPFLPGSIITIDNNNTPCDLDDTISGSISLGAATRAFAGGPGTQGEETWGDGDIVFPIPETTVDAATPNGAGGCDYEIADQGFPPLLQSTGGGTYIFDTDIVENPGPFPEDSWVASSPVGVACVTEGNCGISVAVTVGPGWSCVENAPGPCEEGPDGGSNFRGTRGTFENFLISISTNGSGDITAGTIFATNESKVFSVPPDPFNSWDGPLLTFSGTCNNCGLARNDNYTILAADGTATLDIGANDSASLVDPTTISITQPPPAGSVTNISSPGDIKTMTVDYTPPALPTPFIEQFQYQVDDGVNSPATATVTVTVEADTLPVANDIDRTLNTQGIAPSTLSDSFNALTEGGNMPGDDGVVTVDSASFGAASTNGTTITYVPGATFFSGSDSFGYTITDKQADADSGAVTITIPDVVPIANDTAATTDRFVPTVIPISYTLGNGSLTQHSVTANASNGSCTVNLNTAIANYTPTDDFFGDDTCTYTIGDGDGSSDSGTISITVNFVEDLIPVAVDDEVQIQSGQSVLIDVLTNDSLGNPPNVVTIETFPSNGSAFIQSGDRIRYFPNFMFFGPDSFQYRITDLNGDTDVATVNVGVFFTSGMVSIDIIPGKEINNINLQAGGRIPVAILSEGEFFDAPAIVDPFSLKLGPREANIIGTPSVSDVDGDGDDDLVVKFLIQQTGIPCGAPATNLQGRTFAGGFIFGDDSINTFQCRKRPITY
jgi:hypothetical protein